jgi:hypothetical protein
MIFAVPGHIERIKARTKTETRRRQALNYKKGRLYSIQPKRTAKGIPDGKILVLNKILELKEKDYPISVESALAEGCYTPEEYEKLYEKLNPGWNNRTAIKFSYVPTWKLQQLTLSGRQST